MNILSKILLFIFGWKILHKDRIYKKSVVAVFPHTSYWDGVIGYIALKSLKCNYKVLSAEWLFFWPMKYIMKYILHAFPVGKHSGNAITTSLDIFRTHDKANLIICPEGQLDPTDKWNMGFYIIAKKAQVPINIVVFDYKRKQIYIDNISVELLNDMSITGIMKYINEFNISYAYAKHPEKFLKHKI